MTNTPSALEVFMMEEAAAAYVVAELAERRSTDTATRMRLYHEETMRLQRRERGLRREIRELTNIHQVYAHANQELSNENARLAEALTAMTNEADLYRRQANIHMRNRQIPPALHPYILRRRERMPRIQARRTAVVPLAEFQASDNESVPETDEEAV